LKYRRRRETKFLFYRKMVFMLALNHLLFDGRRHGLFFPFQFETRYYYNTVWKFEKFTATQILREINLANLETQKWPIWRFWGQLQWFLHFEKFWQFLTLLIGQNGFHKIWVAVKFLNFHTMHKNERSSKKISYYLPKPFFREIKNKYHSKTFNFRRHFKITSRWMHNLHMFCSIRAIAARESEVAWVNIMKVPTDHVGNVNINRQFSSAVVRVKTVD